MKIEMVKTGDPWPTKEEHIETKLVSLSHERRISTHSIKVTEGITSAGHERADFWNKDNEYLGGLIFVTMKDIK